MAVQLAGNSVSIAKGERIVIAVVLVEELVLVDKADGVVDEQAATIASTTTRASSTPSLIRRSGTIAILPASRSCDTTTGVLMDSGHSST